MDRRGQVFRTEGHPRGSSDRPTFTITSDVAYSTGHGTNDVGVAWFAIAGSMVYPASGHPLGESNIPRYQIRS